jgi:hypothetical protein
MRDRIGERLELLVRRLELAVGDFELPTALGDILLELGVLQPQAPQGERAVRTHSGA